MRNLILAFIFFFSQVLAAAPAGNVVLLDLTASEAFTDWQTSWTPTGTWTTNTTYSAKWKRAGDTMHVQLKVTVSGAPNATTLRIDPPSGYAIDTAKLNYSGGGDNWAAIGQASINDHGTAGYVGIVIYESSTGKIAVVTQPNAFVNSTIPMTWAASDSVSLEFMLPIVGWTTPRRPVPFFFGPNHQTTDVKTSAYTIKASDTIVQADTTGGAFTLTLPSASDAGKGKELTISKVNSGANLLTVNGSIESTTRNTVLHAQGESITLWSDGATWRWRSDPYRTETAYITATPVVDTQSGNWISSVGRVATGILEINIPSEIFYSIDPMVTANVVDGGTTSVPGVRVGPGKTQILLITNYVTGSTVTMNNYPVSVMVKGKR